MTSALAPPAPARTAAGGAALAASGALLAALAALALAAWALGEPEYLQLDPARPPFHYNGALAFLVWGAAHLALSRGRLGPARTLAGVLALGGLACMLVSLSGGEVRLDTWALDPEPHLGRFPPAGVTAGFGLGCVLGATAVLLAARAGGGPLQSLFGVLTGAFLGASAPIMLFTTPAGTAGAPAGPAVLGAIGVALAGLALLPGALQRGVPNLILGRAVPVAVGLAGIGVTLALWAALSADQDRRIRRQAQYEAAHVQRSVLERFGVELDRVVELAGKWPEPAPGPVPEQMRLDVGLYLGQTPGCVGVARVDAGLGVEWVEPRSGEPVTFAGLGGGEELTDAVRTGRVAVVRPPRSFWNGQRVLLVYAPHRSRSPGGGFVSVIVVHRFFGTVVNPSLASGHAVAVYEGADEVYARGDACSPGQNRWVEVLPVRFRDREWRLAVCPTPDALARESLSLPKLALLIGLALTALLALAVHLAQTARHRTAALENEMRERQLAELALRQSEAKHRTLIENLGQGVFLQDTEHRYVAVNGPFCERVGRPEADIIGRTDADLFDPEQAARRAGEVRAVLAEGRVVESEGEEVAGERRRCIRRVLTPVRDAAGRVTGVLGICWDVTQQRQLEEHLNQASKMDAIGQLAGGIAHDFNNLLTVILGSLEVLLAGADPRGADVPLLTSAQSAGQRAAALTQRLLGFARKHQLDWRPTSINAVVAEVVALLQRTIDPLTRIETDLDPDLWLVESDPTQLNQVLMNLCINARDAIGGTGVIGIATACVTGAEVACPGACACDPRGEYVRLRVTDTGAGMPPEVKARMFEPFFTTKGVGKGTGLGLAMVFAIVRQHKGWIDCASEVGAGTRFDIYLPRAAAAKPPASAPAPLPVRRAGQGTVLVVDDEELIRALAAAALQAAGYNVIQTADGREAVDAYTRERDRIDLVLLDLTMPVLSGHEAFRQMVTLNPRVKVLIASGYSTEQLSDLEQEKMVGFIKKPYRPSELVAAVDDALPGRSGFRMKSLSGPGEPARQRA